MWLSKKILNITNNNYAKLGDITASGNNKVCSQSEEEFRDISLITLSGIAYSPNEGEECVVLPTANNETVCIGVKMSNKELNPGEIMIYSGEEAKIILKKDGTVNIYGQVFINDESL